MTDFSPQALPVDVGGRILFHAAHRRCATLLRTVHAASSPLLRARATRGDGCLLVLDAPATCRIAFTVGHTHAFGADDAFNIDISYGGILLKKGVRRPRFHFLCAARSPGTPHALTRAYSAALPSSSYQYSRRALCVIVFCARAFSLVWTISDYDSRLRRHRHSHY